MKENEKSYEWIMVYAYGGTDDPEEYPVRTTAHVAKMTGTREEIKTYIEGALSGKVEFDCCYSNDIRAHVTAADCYYEERIVATRVDALSPVDSWFADCW